MTEGPLLKVKDLRIEVEGRGIDIVDEVSFEVEAGEVLGLVGESGSGKTTVGLALLGHARRGVRIASGRVTIGGEDMLGRSAADLRRLRGRLVSHVAQDPGVALNPALRIGTLLTETLEAHDFGNSPAERQGRLTAMLGEVALPSDREFLRRYPHQLSGGQLQRVMLAIAFATRPRVIVLDEPTTGLDVTTQAHVLTTVRHLCKEHGVAALYVTHDLAVVANLADRVAVMYAGRMVELGPQRQLFTLAGHPYTRKLIQAIPEISGLYELNGIPGRAPPPGRRPAGCFFAPRCDFAIDRCSTEFPPQQALSLTHTVRCWRHEDVLAQQVRERVRVTRVDPAFDTGSLLSVRDLRAAYGGAEILHGINLELRPQECLGLVGESGSGKTTLAKCIGGLHVEYSGDVVFRGHPLARNAYGRPPNIRRSVQYIFQNPYSSLNPRRTIGQIVGQPLSLFFDLDHQETQRRVGQALERVSLPWQIARRYPDQLSGGERQRVAIARALAAEPDVLISDEITSALDVSVQAALVELLAELQKETGVALLFVTHNLALVRTIAHEVAVLNAGDIVEFGSVGDVLGDPKDAYTQKLLANTPSFEGVLAGASATAPVRGATPTPHTT